MTTASIRGSGSTSETRLGQARTAVLMALFFLPLLFPDGRLPSPLELLVLDAEFIVDSCAARLRDVTDLAEIEGGAVDAVARSLGPRAAAVWVRPDQGRPA